VGDVFKLRIDASISTCVLGVLLANSISAHSAGVVSICCFQSGTTTNVIPDTATLKGTIRDFEPTVGATLLRRVKEVVAGVCEAFGVTGEVIVDDSYPSIINSEEPTTFITELCEDLFGRANVLKHVAPMPGAEDFSYFAQKVPGCFVQIGGGSPECVCRSCHQSNYDFNDGILPLAMGLWVRLAEARLGVTLYPDPTFFPAPPKADPSHIARFVADMTK
jgi:hippurate hydrolase